MEMKLGGETLRCHDQVLQGAMLDLAEAFESGARGLKGVIGIGRFLRTAVVDEDRPRLEELLYRRENPLTYQDLADAAGELIVAYNDTPLDERSSPGTGYTETGAPMKVVSLSRGTVEVEKKSRRVGRSRAS